MAEVLGLRTIIAKALPTGVDGTRIAQWQLRSGKSYRQWVSEAATALAGWNAEMARMWGWLYGLTEEIMMEYPNGGSVTPMPQLPDTDRIEPKHGTTIGHMIDLIAYGDAMGGTRRYFRDLREAQADADLQRIILSAQWRFEQAILTRWFTNTENSVGTSGYDVPFVRGTGGTVDFAPPAYGGEAFTTSHNHYLGVDSDNLGYDDALNQLAETLQEHGHNPPYNAMVSRADIASYYALPDFIEPLPPNVMVVDRGTTTADTGAALFAREDREFGRVGSFNSEYGVVVLRATNRVPTKYLGMCKSYGQDNPRNPLAIRVHPDVGFGAYIIPETSIDDDYPLKQIDVEFEFGVSVGRDRTNGAVAYLVSGGAWANPTIT